MILVADLDNMYQTTCATFGLYWFGGFGYGGDQSSVFPKGRGDIVALH
jgi:hypothetical protein